MTSSTTSLPSSQSASKSANGFPLFSISPERCFAIGVGGEFAFLNPEVNAVGENRIDEAMRIADAEKAFARVVSRRDRRSSGSRELAPGREVRQSLGERPASYAGIRAASSLLLRHAGFLEIVGRNYHADAGQFVAYRDEPGPVDVSLDNRAACCPAVAKVRGPLSRMVLANWVNNAICLSELPGNFRPGHPMIGQESGATGGIDQHFGIKILRRASRRADGQSDDRIFLHDGSDCGCFDPDRRRVPGRRRKESCRTCCASRSKSSSGPGLPFSLRRTSPTQKSFLPSGP